jgi:hypothetical protein
MRVETWEKGSVPELDLLFDQLREQQYQDRSHRLWQNYSKTSFEHAGIIACTIYFDDDNLPELCSSIASRTCWPTDAFRILNRAWKPNNKKLFLRKISDCMGKSAISQINWLAKNTDCKLYFVSRQTDHWDHWVISNFKSQFKLEFETDAYKYLTCPNESDNTCWQTIIYNGNLELLEQWKRK